ncbi:MAG: hypothetical protein ACTSPS_12150 [Promethearchaeota archaeon]
MANFLLIIEEIINYTKKDIDKGYTPPLIYKICCSCIRETFCLSYAIRKNNTLYLYFQKEKILIKFEGSNLRYLGPDERSQALLLKKALDKITSNINSNGNKWIKSTPGIYSKSFLDDFSFIDYLDSSVQDPIIFIYDEVDSMNEINMPEIKNINSLENLRDNFYIIPTYPISKNNNIIKLMLSLTNIKLVTIPKIKSIQDKILYINYLIDKIQ